MDKRLTTTLRNPSTPEDLEMRGLVVLPFADLLLVAGHFWQGPGKPEVFGAVYEFLTEDQSAEGLVGLQDVSGIEFYDTGHAIAWAIERSEQ